MGAINLFGVPISFGHAQQLEKRMADPALRHALRNKEFILAPGVFELISALIADRMDFKALYVTGYGTVASYLGLPDAGIATYRDMVERIAQIVKMTKTPVIADADTGYGGLLNVRHTIRGYEDAGVSAIQIEDQEFPKKCGHTPNRRVVPLEDMVRKVEVAVDSRRSDDFLIIARTDARTSQGLPAAIERGRAFAQAGADIVFVEAPESEAEFAQVGDALRGDAWLFANMVPSGNSPVVSAANLEKYGFSIVIYPTAGMNAACAALESAYKYLEGQGSTDGSPVPTYSMKQLHELVGFPDVWAFEKRFPEIGTE
jgi:2-methylisocitrate lyase-like PEP mutase family enzyme